jgi:hypothetical protein
MALHPIRHDYSDLLPHGGRLTARMERLFDNLLEQSELLNRPELTTVVLQVGKRDTWRIKLTLDLDDVE